MHILNESTNYGIKQKLERSLFTSNLAFRTSAGCSFPTAEVCPCVQEQVDRQFEAHYKGRATFFLERPCSTGCPELVEHLLAFHMLALYNLYYCSLCWGCLRSRDDSFYVSDLLLKTVSVLRMFAFLFVHPNQVIHFFNGLVSG